MRRVYLCLAGLRIRARGMTGPQPFLQAYCLASESDTTGCVDLIPYHRQGYIALASEWQANTA